MSARSVRRLVIAVCVLGIGGMIAGSIADNNGAAMTAGLVTATAVLCLIVATAVTAPRLDSVVAGSEGDGSDLAEGLAADVELGIVGLVSSGAEEAAVRELVGTAVRLGRLRAGQETRS